MHVSSDDEGYSENYDEHDKVIFDCDKEFFFFVDEV